MAKLLDNLQGLQNISIPFDTGLGSNKGSQNLPWSTKESDSVFFPPLQIDPDRWDKLYPYRLLVVEINGSSAKIVKGGSSSFKIKTSTAQQGLDYILSQEILTGGWICNLPITPQQLQVTDQFAINTSATSRGIVEEHNGLKFKQILASGTTGIWSRRPSVGANLTSTSSIGTILGNTISAANNLANSANRLVNTIKGKNTNKLVSVIKPKDSEAGEYSTGYYQALYLQQFFERYAEAKKNPKNKHWRLVFDIPKQNQSFVVTPVSFSLNQNQQKPNEILFTFALKAWKRIDLGAGQKVNLNSVITPKIDVKTFQRIINTISETRRLLSGSVNLVKAVRSDFQNVFDVLRQTVLVVKDVMGLGLTIADMPKQIVQDFKSTVITEWTNLGKTSDFQKSNSSTQSGNSVSPVAIKSTTSSKKTGDIMSSVVAKDHVNEGQSYDSITSGVIGYNASQSQKSDPINNIFDSPEEYFEAFDAVSLDNLQLSPEQQEAVQNEVDNAKTISVDDFRTFRTQIYNLMLDISDNFGAGNQTFSDLYGRTTPKTRTLAMTMEENEILESLMGVIQEYDSLIATKKWDDLSTQNPLEYVGGLANESDINFDSSYPSKYLVPVPYGLTIEQIAARYLGDPDKWLEIVTLNKLRSPYIDEDGFTYDLISNAEGRQFTVDDSSGFLYIGQKIIIKSDTVSMFSRIITDVVKISDNNYLVTVDGLADLDTLTSTDNAKILGYLPGTTNSQNQIYIPSFDPSEPDDRTHGISHLDNQNLVKLSKIDWLLTDDMDLAINTVGDFRLSSGLNNLIQAFQLKILTKKGTILRHLNYGLGINVGMSNADLQSGDIVRDLNAMIEEDPRYESIDRLVIKLNGNTLEISLSIVLPNNNGRIPINFSVKL